MVDKKLLNFLLFGSLIFVFVALFIKTSVASKEYFGRNLTPTPSTAPTTIPTPLTEGQTATGSGKNALGVFVNDASLGGGAPWTPAVMDNFVNLVGGKPTVWHWYQTIRAGYQQNVIDSVTSRGYTPAISWAPDFSWNRVAAGAEDRNVRNFAKGAAAWGQRLYLRPEWEMNLKFNSRTNTPQNFVAMWKHIHDIFVQEGATNVKWFWCPNEDGENPNVPYSSYYPGDNYVDYIGFDAYNWGTTQSWSSWRTPVQVYGPTYNALTKLTDKPLIIGETGSVEQGGDKAAWIRQAFLTDIPQNFPRIISVWYFNEVITANNWVVNTSQSSLDAFKEVISSPMWNYRLP